MPPWIHAEQPYLFPNCAVKDERVFADEPIDIEVVRRLSPGGPPYYIACSFVNPETRQRDITTGSVESRNADGSFRGKIYVERLGKWIDSTIFTRSDSAPDLDGIVSEESPVIAPKPEPPSPAETPPAPAVPPVEAPLPIPAKPPATYTPPTDTASYKPEGWRYFEVPYKGSMYQVLTLEKGGHEGNSIRWDVPSSRWVWYDLPISIGKATGLAMAAPREGDSTAKAFGKKLYRVMLKGPKPKSYLGEAIAGAVFKRPEGDPPQPPPPPKIC